MQPSYPVPLVSSSPCRGSALGLRTLPADLPAQTMRSRPPLRPSTAHTNKTEKRRMIPENTALVRSHELKVEFTRNGNEDFGGLASIQPSILKATKLESVRPGEYPHPPQIDARMTDCTPEDEDSKDHLIAHEFEIYFASQTRTGSVSGNPHHCTTPANEDTHIQLKREASFGRDVDGRDNESIPRKRVRITR